MSNDFDFSKINELTDKIVEEIQQSIHLRREHTSQKFQAVQDMILPETIRQRKARKI